jgi:hypothetical protein
MAREPIPEFALDLPVRAPAERDDPASAEERILGLRTKLEYFYGEMKRGQRKEAAGRRRFAEAERRRLLEFIRVADSFEDVFRMCDENKTMRKQKETLQAFQTTCGILLDVLEDHGAYRVDVTGKSYGDVEFEGVPIPEPWTVVGAPRDESLHGKQRTVRRVVRSLWVQVVGDTLSVLRRAQVVY